MTQMLKNQTTVSPPYYRAWLWMTTRIPTNDNSDYYDCVEYKQYNALDVAVWYMRDARTVILQHCRSEDAVALKMKKMLVMNMTWSCNGMHNAMTQGKHLSATHRNDIIPKIRKRLWNIIIRPRKMHIRHRPSKNSHEHITYKPQH